MLISTRYTNTCRVVIRNPAFPGAVVVSRLALTSSPYSKIVIGVTVAACSLGLTLVYNEPAPIIHHVSACRVAEWPGVSSPP